MGKFIYRVLAEEDDSTVTDEDIKNFEEAIQM